MIGIALFSAAIGVVFGGALVFATVSWVSTHVAVLEKKGEKLGVLQTGRVLVAVRVK